MEGGSIRGVEYGESGGDAEHSTLADTVADADDEGGAAPEENEEVRRRFTRPAIAVTGMCCPLYHYSEEQKRKVFNGSLAYHLRDQHYVGATRSERSRMNIKIIASNPLYFTDQRGIRMCASCTTPFPANRSNTQCDVCSVCTLRSIPPAARSAVATALAKAIDHR